jgi:hypothetical protein
MRYPYVVILKRTNDRIIDRISLLLCSFSGASFLLVQIQARHFNFFLLSAALVILTGSFVTWGMSRRYKADPPLHPGKRVRYRYWLLTAALGWVGMPQLQWLSVLFVLLTVLEYQAKYPLEIGFSPDRIVINSLFRKEFNWSAFSNIMLKDGLLTLDFKDNRLLQKEVDEEEEGDAEEDEFNDYCRDRLKEAITDAQRQADGKPK